MAFLTNEMIEQVLAAKDDQTVASWERRFAYLLHQTPQFIVEKKTFGPQVGLFIEVAKGFFTGKTDQAFARPTTLNLGFDLDIKRSSRLVLDLSMGFIKQKPS